MLFLDLRFFEIWDDLENNIYWDGQELQISCASFYCISLRIFLDILLTLNELTSGKDINLSWININTLKASTSLTNKEFPGQYLGRVKQNLSQRKLGYILPTFYTPSQGGHRLSPGNILWKGSLSQTPRMLFPLYTGVARLIYVLTNSCMTFLLVLTI